MAASTLGVDTRKLGVRPQNAAAKCVTSARGIDVRWGNECTAQQAVVKRGARPRSGRPRPATATMARGSELHFVESGRGARGTIRDRSVRHRVRYSGAYRFEAVTPVTTGNGQRGPVKLEERASGKDRPKKKNPCEW